MASFPSLRSRRVDPEQEAPLSPLEARSPSGHRSLFDSTIGTPLTAANTVEPRETTSAARALGRASGGISPAEPSAAVRRGERAAKRALEAKFKPFYDAHFQLVWCALRRLGVRDADLMDVTQKVFLAAYLKMPHFDGRSPVSAWLYGICRRLAAAYRRSGAIRHEIACDPGVLEVSIERRATAASETDPNVRVTAEYLMSKLSEKQRVVFTLFEVVELSAPEVAALLDIPIETVRSRLRCGRERCRREVRRLTLVSAFSKAKRQNA